MMLRSSEGVHSLLYLLLYSLRKPAFSVYHMVVLAHSRKRHSTAPVLGDNTVHLRASVSNGERGIPILGKYVHKRKQQKLLNRRRCDWGAAGIKNRCKVTKAREGMEHSEKASGSLLLELRLFRRECSKMKSEWEPGVKRKGQSVG